MGKRGPKPTPTPILKARGSWRANLRVGEPKPPSTKPSCPSWLSPIGKACWKWLTTQLETMGLLSTADAKALERYCEAYSEYRETVAAIKEKGRLITLHDANGNVVQAMKNPMLIERGRLSAELLRLEQQFGLTPSARVGMKVPSPRPSAGSGEEERGPGRFFRRA